MRKIGVVIGILFLSIVLSACKENEVEITKTLTLKNGEEVIEEYDDLENGEVIDLPVLEEEGLIFLGWSDGEDMYYHDYRFEKMITLEATFEDVSEVFETTSEGDLVVITGYHGDATVLKIPPYINLEKVVAIDHQTFSSDDIEELMIPVSIEMIRFEAFVSMDSLESISFYGDYIGEFEMTINNETYQSLINDYLDICVKAEISERNWIFLPGCPVKEVLDHTDPIMMNDEEFISYTVVLDSALYDNLENQVTISQHAFSDLPRLSEVSFPSRYRDFEGDVFHQTPKLQYVTFEDNDTYTVQGGVVYSEDETVFVYYPQGKTEDSFAIPSGVVEVLAYAFYDNQYIKSLWLPTTVELAQNIDNYVFFHHLSALEEFVVEEGHELYYAIDGVLYGKFSYGDSEYHALVFYPPMKQGEEYVVLEQTIALGFHAFLNQTLLEELTLPPNLESISPSVFKGTTKITRLDLPSSVELIFRDMTEGSMVEEVIVNNSVLVDGSIPMLGVYQEPSYYPKYYVPSDSLGVYLDAEGWRDIHEYIYTIETLDLDIETLYEYEIIDEEYAVITSYIGTLDVVKIPSMIEGYIVLELSSDAFTGSSVKELYIPTTVEVYDLTSLEAITSLEVVSFFNQYGLVE